MLSPDCSDNISICMERLYGMPQKMLTVWLEQLVEDMVRPLNLLLLSDTGLLKQVGHDV